MNRQLPDQQNVVNVSLIVCRYAVGVVELTALTNRACAKQKGDGQL